MAEEGGGDGFYGEGGDVVLDETPGVGFAGAEPLDGGAGGGADV